MILGANRNANHPKFGDITLKKRAASAAQYQPNRIPDPSMEGMSQVEAAILGNTIINPELHHDIGGVSQVPNSQNGEPYFSLTFDNSGGGAAVRYRFGTDQAADLLGLGALPVATSGSNDVDAINWSLGTAPVLVGAIFYSATVAQSQFSQEFTYHRGGKRNGANVGSEAFPVTLAKRPTYENDLLLIIQSQNPWRFGQFEVGTITVEAGETVVLDFMPAAVSGR